MRVRVSCFEKPMDKFYGIDPVVVQDYEVNGFMYVTGGKMANVLEQSLKKIDDLSQYLVLELKNGELLVYRDNYVNMHRIDPGQIEEEADFLARKQRVLKEKFWDV
jgi:hypothetical protein